MMSAVFRYLQRSLACLCHVGRFAIEQSQESLGVCYGRSNRLLDFVGKGSGQLPDRADSVHMGKMGSQVEETELRTRIPPPSARNG
jgi:hypothetical protein